MCPSILRTDDDRNPCNRDATLADHGARIKALERAQVEDRSELRSLKNWIMGTLAAACGGLLVQLFALIKK